MNADIQHKDLKTQYLHSPLVSRFQQSLSFLQLQRIEDLFLPIVYSYNRKETSPLRMFMSAPCRKRAQTTSLCPLQQAL